MKSAILVAVLLGAAVAGCMAKQDTAPAPPLPLLQRTASHVPPIRYDEAAGVQWWSDFVQTYTLRHAYTPGNIAARDHIAASMKAAGFDVTIRQYPAGAFGANTPPGVGPPLINVVVATKTGSTDPHHAIALGAHYDTVAAPSAGLPPVPPSTDLNADLNTVRAGTVQGAYDNGSGTALVYNACKALALAPMNRTLLCLFFDGEEEGTVGSQAFQKDMAKGDLTMDFYLGFDMTGINWPGIDTAQPGMQKWKLYAWVGDEFATDLFPFVNGTLHQVLGYPASGSEAFPFNDRNSDEATFKVAHIPTVRFAGGRTAGLYPQYHKPMDTVDYVYQFVGGRERFEQGFGAVVRTACQLTLQLDQTSLAALKTAYT